MTLTTMIFKFPENQRVTIITGPNGIWKTNIT